jgi:hypothetical protein
MRTRPDISLLAIIDMQEKLLAAMPVPEKLLLGVAFITEVAQLLHVPILISEQYPQGLGPTIASLKDKSDLPVIAKTTFSAFACEAWRKTLERTGCRTICLAGMETNICVMQTALNLLDAGYRVQLITDAVQARRTHDHDLALQRLTHAGATITTAETLAFEWLGDASDPAFKQISQLVKQRSVSFPA